MNLLTLSVIILAISAEAFSQELVSRVNPFIGTGVSNVTGEAVPGGKGGATQPAAVVPFGMVQIGPDTDRPETSGYNYDNKAIRNFSMTHLSGPGCRNMGEVAFLPGAGDNLAGSWPAPYTFSKKTESASPGYYRVRFDNGIGLEVSASERTGIARINFGSEKKSSSAEFLINTGINGIGKTQGRVVVTGKRQLRGHVMGGGFCNSRGRYPVFFAMQFDHDITSFTFQNNVARTLFSGSIGLLTARVGISFVSERNAELNLAAENLPFSFEEIHQRARRSWEKALSVVTLSDRAAPDVQTVFYTALYHSLLHPNIGSDVNGEYRGFDQKVHHSPRPYYVNFSGWDIYRSQVQLLAFLFPQRAGDIAQSLILAGKACGSLPKWALNSIETNIMSGDPGALTIANMYAFGARNFDHRLALALIKKASLDPLASCQGHRTRFGLADLNNRGYIPEPVKKGNWSSASIMLELASADFGVSQYAYDRGEHNFARQMMARSTRWRKLWDPSTQLVRPRDENLRWITDFSATSQKGFMEGNSAQYTWMVPHDLSTLVKVMGGGEATARRLDKFMSQTNAGQAAPHLYLGNEPAFGVPWIYLWARKPERAQEQIRRLLTEEFKNSPGGLTGNDDLGALSSWYVWSSMGMFPALPGVPGVTIGSPLFDSITITPEGEKPIHISAPGAASRTYVRSVQARGVPILRTWITLKALKAAGGLNFEMSSAPSDWGTAVGSEPPSLIEGQPVRWPIQ